MRRDDPWSADDPAVLRTREAMALLPVQEPRSDPKPPAAVSEDVKRAGVASLVARLRANPADFSARETLTQLLNPIDRRFPQGENPPERPDLGG